MSHIRIDPECKVWSEIAIAHISTSEESVFCAPVKAYLLTTFAQPSAGWRAFFRRFFRRIVLPPETVNARHEVTPPVQALKLAVLLDTGADIPH